MVDADCCLDDPVILAREITQIKGLISRFTNDLVYTLEDKCVRLSWNPNDSVILANIRELARNVNELETRVDRGKTEFIFSQTEIESLCNDLKECSIAYDIAKTIIDVKNKIRDLTDLHNNGSCFAAAELSQDLRTVLSRENQASVRLGIFQSIKEQILEPLDKSNFLAALSKWNGLFVFSYFESDNCHKTVTLTFNGNQRDEVEDVLKALCLYGVIEEYVARFSKKLLVEIIEPCISYYVDIKPKRNSLSIQVDKTNSKGAEQAIADVGTVLKFFHQTFRFHLTGESDGDFVGQVGKIVAKDMLSRIIDEQLERAIPCRRKDMPSYMVFVEKVDSFCSFLEEIGFLPCDNSMLRDYCSNLEDKIRNKMTGNYFARAREIYGDNIHDMVVVEQSEPDEALPFMDATRRADRSTWRPTEISSNLCLLPRCQISKHVLDLLKLIHEILDEASTGDYSDKDRLPLYSVAVDIVEIYPHFIGIAQKKKIEALLHNNCFYLAHKMVTIGSKYENHRFCFVDLVPQLRKCGVQVLDNHVAKQKDIILGALSNAGLSSLSDYEKLPETVKKPINQCIHQLSYLHSVWSDVLPDKVYHQVIGNLCNLFVQEVTSKVIKTKDIREETAQDLINLFTVVLEKIPSFFPEGEVHRFVKLWLKFTSFVQVLSASLTEIDEFWADGKGPLAMHFHPYELKSLIKALFQDTEKREALLMRIN